MWGNRTYIEGWGGIGRVEATFYTNNRRSGYIYDAAGNLTDELGQTFTYDATGQQATANYSGYSLQQTYDGDRLRVKKVENTATTYYLRSTVLGGQIVAELNSSGAMTRGFVYQGVQLLAVQQDNQVSWVHEDPVAKSKRVTNSSGNVVSTIELDPWGGDTTTSSNEAFQPRRFTSYDRDGNGSDEAMHRRYNRWHMRFDQPDPYGGSYDMTDPQSFNRYSYVQNDPVNFVDPLGLDPGALGGAIADSLNPIGPGTVTVTVNINRGSDDFMIEDGPAETGRGTFGGGGGGGGAGPQNPADSSEVERLLTESCVHFLNSILAELGKIRNPYSYNFLGIFRPAKDRTSFDTVRLTAEEKKERLGGTHSTISDPNFYIELDEGLFNRSDLTAGYVTIHELFHGASASRTGYNHTEMAQAAYNVALSNPAVMNKLKNTGHSGPPRQVDYTPGGNFNKANDWYNAGVFDTIVRIGCPIPPT